MNTELQKILNKQRYAIVGNHAGVKLCHWMRQSLLFDRVCYKEKFYGIQSHRCLQMTPTITHCTQMCLFCWRYQHFTEQRLQNIDDPEVLLDDSIKAQQRLITGFKGDKRCDQLKWKEACMPNMIACSLSGEPTLYPRLGEFFERCHRKNMTTFLVTNGTNPDVLEHLDPLPTQLYISVVAPTKQIYKRLCAPLVSDGWERLQKTLSLLPSLSTRTVIRHTLVYGWNMKKKDISAYARLDKKADPLFIEPKGYVFVGSSRQRLTIDHMPQHETVCDFGYTLASEMGYSLIQESSDSRVVLLGSNPDKKMISK